MVLLDPNELPTGDDVCNSVAKATSAVTANAGVVTGDYKELMILLIGGKRGGDSQSHCDV
jgi:hypothetical protein